MKQRIEKLVEQAGIWKPTHDHKTWVRGEYVASPGELEKFAELIVRECIQVAIEQKQWVEKQQPTFNYDDDKWDRARIQQSQHIVDKIRKHFGVEE